ncbi:MAG: hypothetical protein AAF988_05680 [Pseudomonadota bacterium]
MKRIFQQKKTRKQIEAEAFAQMRKTKAALDPGVLAKVREAIQKSPIAAQLMGNIPAQQAMQQTEEKSEPEKQEISSKEIPTGQVKVQPSEKKKKALESARAAHANIKDQEPVDQSKMLDIVAKTLELNPHKTNLKDGVKKILSEKS